MTDRSTLLAELSALMRSTSDDELRTFHRLATRVMGKGRESYGPMTLAGDGRDFTKEAQDEIIDYAWYLAIREVLRGD